MAMVPTYQRQVQINEAPGYRVQPAAGPESFGAGFGQALSNTGTALNEMAVKQQAKLNQIAVANAMSNMQQSLTPIQTDLLMRKGQNALGTAATEDKPATPSVTQEWQQRSSELFDKTMKSLANENQRQQFGMWWNSVHPGMDDAVYKHEKTQLDVAHTAAGEAQLSASSDSFVSNALIGASIGNFTMANNDLLSGMKMSSDRGIINGLPDAALKENSNKFVFSCINKAIDIAISNNRSEDGKKILDQYGDKLSEAQRQMLMAKIRPQLEKYQEADEFYKAKSDQQFYTNGVFDAKKWEDHVNSLYGPEAKKSVPVNIESFDGGINAFSNALVGIESGGNYDAKGPVQSDGDYAIGKYQIMKSNWSSWAQEAGLPPDAPPTPENQDIIFKNKTKQYYTDFGGDWGKVAIAWHAGPGRADLTDNDLAKLSDGNMTTLDYKNNIISQMRNDQPNEVSASDPDKVKRLVSMGYALQRDQIAERSRQESEYRKNLAKQLDQAGSESAAREILNNADPGIIGIDTYNALDSAITRKYVTLTKGIATPEQKFYAKYERDGLYKDQSTLEMLSDKYAAGDELTEAEWKRYSDTKFRYDRYQNFITNGAYGEQQKQQQQQRYQEILSDLWDSGTYEERAKKANQYKKELNDLGQQLDIDVNNDVQFIMNNGQG